MSTSPTMRNSTAYPDDSRSEESMIDRSSAFDGVLRTARNLRVEGQAKGEIYCDGTLFIEEGAQVDARIVSANITVAGTLAGEITCHGKMQILPTGHVSGRVATASLAIQEGAIYEGELRMSNLDEDPPDEVPSLSTGAQPSSQTEQGYRARQQGGEGHPEAVSAGRDPEDNG